MFRLWKHEDQRVHDAEGSTGQGKPSGLRQVLPVTKNLAVGKFTALVLKTIDALIGQE